MVRSSSSCFKILACGSDDVDKDELERTESKESTDKRGWSFRKRSSQHRVLSNTVILETPSTGNKESPESTTISSDPKLNSAVPEKVSEPQWTDEKPELSTALHSRENDPPVATENTSKIDPNLEESSAVVIQAAIREYLAQRTLLKLKNVIKLQAAVRGHLVRRHAVGTLRCVQAIVKMQTLVRARRARLLVEGSVNERTEQTTKLLGKENSGTKPNQNYSSTKKLLSNGFARQLLESAPKTKAIHIKCDASRSNSAWNWLERWMIISSSELAHSDKPECPENEEQGENIKATASGAGPALPAVDVAVTEDIKSNSRETVMAIESEESLITYDADNLDFQAGHPSFSSKRDDLDQPHIQNVDLGKVQNADNLCFQGGLSNCPSVKDDLDQPRVEDVCLSELGPSKIDLLPTQTEMQSGVISQTVLNSVSEKLGLNSEQPKHNMKRIETEQLETEGKKFVFGSRKVSNPAFIAAQSKFEELSSSATSGRPISSINQDLGTESKLDNLPSEDSVMRTKESSLTEYSISHDPKVQVGGSECGTELSISSTLDSLDLSEVGGELEHESKVAERKANDVNSTSDNEHKLGSPVLEAKNFSSSTPPPNLPHDVFGQPWKDEEVNRESSDPIVDVGSPRIEQQQDRSVSDVQVQVDSIMDQQACKSSPEGSPRSHMTALESHGTPSSQVSFKAKRDKLERSGSNQNRRNHTTNKRSPSSQNDSGARSSTEKLPRDSKNGKRRNSFGSARSDPIDQDRRDSSSSNSLPSYMQATESAKAKAQIAHNSPRSSPDMQDKDIYIKKRHSLPSANGKQDSPRMQRSTSQAQQGVKGNGTHSPPERKWQR